MLRFDKVVLSARRSARKRNRIARSLGREWNRIVRSFGQEGNKITRRCWGKGIESSLSESTRLLRGIFIVEGK